MSRQRNLSADIIRVIAIYLVIYVHSVATRFVDYPDYDTSWWIMNVLYSISRICIPLFLMLSGAFLVEFYKPAPLGKAYAKRISRIVFPFAFYSVLYLFFKYFKKDIDVSITAIISDVFTGSIQFHLWYVYLILLLYLLSPFISNLLQKLHAKEIRLVLIILFLLMTLRFDYYLIFQNDIYLGEYIEFLSYLAYFILGYYLLKVKLKSWANYLFLSSGLLITVFGAHLFAIESPLGGDRIFHSYQAPGVLFISIAIFNLIFHSTPNTSGSKLSLSKLVTSISLLSYGMYLAHILVRNLLTFKIYNTVFNEGLGALIPIPVWIDIFIESLITFFLSYFIILLLYQIKPIRKLIA
jgi:surface polysaccharide O-acyltransferase-like enzyme